MSPNESDIRLNYPLFPLAVVMLPGAELPLYIFEDRYKDLVRRSLKKKAEFGIIYADGTSMRGVGCGARVVNVLRKYPDARMEIIVRGTERFIVQSTITHPSGYLEASITPLLDRKEPMDDETRTDVIGMYNEIVREVFGGTLHELELDHPDERISFRIAQKVGLSIHDRQKLLESSSERERLQFLQRRLKDLLPHLGEAATIQRLIKNDGYIPT
ncbi:MAG: hypothetical protein GXO82_07255 [Chlorobi bacterium]|nr:hypothetical protein [Chlorobiota bacterium]